VELYLRPQALTTWAGLVFDMPRNSVSQKQLRAFAGSSFRAKSRNPAAERMVNFTGSFDSASLAQDDGGDEECRRADIRA